MTTPSESRGPLRGLPKDAYRIDVERGRTLIHISYFAKNPDNPRDEEDYTPDRLDRLMKSIRAEKYGGIHMPVSVYIRDGRAHVIEGHLRLTAAEHLVRQAKDRTDLADENRNALIERYEWIPVAVEETEDDLEILLRMQSSDAIKKTWAFTQRLKHIGRIYEELVRREEISSPDELDDDMAHAVGWDQDKLQVMVRIRLSPVLFGAAQRYATCTYKGWLHLVQIGRLLAEKRKPLMREMTGINPTDTVAFQEAVYQLLVDKLEYYVATKSAGRERRRKAQPGSLLERCTPLVRKKEFPDSRIKQWLVNEIDITPNHLERATGSVERKRKLAAFMRLVHEGQFDARKSEDEQLSLMAQLSEHPDDRSEAVADSENQAAADSTPAEPDSVEMPENPKVQPTTESRTQPSGASDDVEVKPHTRGKPERSGRRKAVTLSLPFSVSLPTQRKEVFALTVSHFRDIVQVTEVAEALSPVEQALVTSALTILGQGVPQTPE